MAKIIRASSFTLPANWYTATIAKIICETRVVDQQKNTAWQNQLFDYASAGGIEYGGGRKYTYAKDKTNPKIDRPQGANGAPITDVAELAKVNPYAYRNKKEFFEEIVECDTPKTTFVTFDIAATVNQSFENSTNIAEYQQLILDSNEYTIKDDYSEILLDMWNTDAGVQTTQTVAIPTYDLSKISDPSLQQWAYQLNSTNIKDYIDKTLTAMTKKNSKFTDEKTQFTQIDKSEVRGIFNAKWIREIAKGGVQMFNPEAIDYMLPDMNRIVLPDDAVVNPLRICTIQSETRHNLISGYQMGFPLVNEVLADQTNFDHYFYGSKKIGYGIFVEFVATNDLVA